MVLWKLGRGSASWAGLAFLVLGLDIAMAAAPDYPDRPVRLVVPFPPGGSVGFVAQTIAPRFQEYTKQPLVIDYKPGAVTNLGSDLVAKSRADGYTLLLNTNSLAINPALYRQMPFDPLKDLAPIVLAAQSPNAFAVKTALPVRSIRELIEYARAKPGELNYGSSGSGSTGHLAMELLKSMAGVNLTHIPFKGAEAVTALISGQIDVLVNPPVTMRQHADAGRLRLLAVTSRTRLEGLNLPTVAESGLPGYESSVWFGVFAPAGTPGGVIVRVNAEFNRALKERQVVDALVAANLTPGGGSVEDLRNLLHTDTERWRPIVKASGAKID